MAAYYNEHDPKAAAWLRELIKAGAIAPGEVDERSIEDVAPSDLRGFTQCHFFSGIGVWSYALRRAEWPDDRPVWTGSCPCQPFSAAGKGAGFDDERHLWPAFYWLIEQCRPAIVFGEQVASKAVDAWIDLVHADLEGLDYAFGCVPFPSAGVGAPHIRDRAYWVADSDSRERDGQSVFRGIERDGTDSRRKEGGRESEPCSDVCGLADPCSERRFGESVCLRPYEGRTEGNLPETSGGSGNGGKYQHRANQGDETASGTPAASPTNGPWRDADWLLCRDGKWRPVEPGTFPLAHGASARVGRLRGYGNAINAEAAKVWIETYMSV